MLIFNKKDRCSPQQWAQFNKSLIYYKDFSQYFKYRIIPVSIYRYGIETIIKYPFILYHSKYWVYRTILAILAYLGHTSLSWPIPAVLACIDQLLEYGQKMQY